MVRMGNLQRKIPYPSSTNQQWKANWRSKTTCGWFQRPDINRLSVSWLFLARACTLNQGTEFNGKRKKTMVELSDETRPIRSTFEAKVIPSVGDVGVHWAADEDNTTQITKVYCHQNQNNIRSSTNIKPSEVKKGTFAWVHWSGYSCFTIS